MEYHHRNDGTPGEHETVIGFDRPEDQARFEKQFREDPQDGQWIARSK